MHTNVEARSDISFMMSPNAVERALIKRHGKDWLLKQLHEYDEIYGHIPVTDDDWETDFQFMRIARVGLQIEIDLDRSTGADVYRLHGFENDEEAILFMMKHDGCCAAAFI